jgi:hypothetical protein
MIAFSPGLSLQSRMHCIEREMARTTGYAQRQVPETIGASEETIDMGSIGAFGRHGINREPVRIFFDSYK